MGMLKFTYILQICYLHLGKVKTDTYPLIRFCTLHCVLTLWIQLKFYFIIVQLALMISDPIKLEHSFLPISGHGSLDLLSHVYYILQGMQG